MGYDRFPEQLIDEKAALLQDLAHRDGRLFYTHDPECALSGLAKDQRGRIVPKEPLPYLAGLES